MKKLTALFAALLVLASAVPALAFDSDNANVALSGVRFAPRDNGDDTDSSPPPEDDGVVDPLEDPNPEGTP